MNNFIKKIVITLSFIIIIFSTISFVNASSEIDAANKLSNLWIIVDNASNPEAYNIEKSITRREMLKVMMNLSLIKVWDTCTGKFTDLPKSDWWCKYAETALERGFIANNSLFRPDDNISKVEALKMIFQAKGLSKDNSFDDWRAWYIEAAIKMGVLSESFTDYDTVWVRGWIFMVSSSAIDKTLNLKLTESQAKIIAEKSCIKWWEALSIWSYNENSKTWWFDANLNSTKQWCYPACVVSEITKTAEINWRCTWLIIP